MLTIKSPIELKCGKTIVPTQEAFYHKIVDNYGMITSGINREDLLHVVTAPPEVYLAEGGMTNLVNSQNIQNTQEMKVEVINNLINRIALTQDVDMTYQDRVYITSMLNKLGVRNVNEFMTQVSRLKQETQTTEQLISLYWNHLEELTEMVEEYHNVSSQEGDQIENRWQQERKHLHQEIMNRLQTGAIYQILNNFYTNHNGADRYVTNQELQITEQKRTSVNILLNRLQNVVGEGKVPFVYRHENVYESQNFNETEITSETVTSQITSAVLLNLVDNLYMNRFERQVNNQSMWVHLEDALYQTAENTLWRMRTELNNQHDKTYRQEITSMERHELQQQEIHAIQYLLGEHREENHWYWTEHGPVPYEMLDRVGEPETADMWYPIPEEDTQEDLSFRQPEGNREIVRESRELFERQVGQYLETIQLQELDDGRMEFTEKPASDRKRAEAEPVGRIFYEADKKEEAVDDEKVHGHPLEPEKPTAQRSQEQEDIRTRQMFERFREQYLEERNRYYEHMGQFVSYLTQQPMEEIQPVETVHREGEQSYEIAGEMQMVTEPMVQAGQTVKRKDAHEISQTIDRWQETSGEERLPEFPPMTPAEDWIFYQKENQLLTEEYQNRFTQVQNQQETIERMEQKLVEEHLHHQDNRREDIQYTFVNPEENLELLEQQLNQINQQNVENYNRYQEMLQQQVQQRKTGRTQTRSMREDSLMALTNPQGLLEEYRKEAENGESDPERQLREMTALLPEETRRIYEQVMRLSESAGQPDQMERITRNNIGLLLHDIRQVQQESTQVREQVNAQTEHIRETIQTETTRWEERQAAKPNVQSQKTFSRRDISMIHKSMENQVNEEFLAQLLEQNRQMQTVTKVNEETITQQQTIKTKTVNQTHNLVTQEHHDINELIQRGVQKQIGTISDQIYSKLERRLQNEKKRRGF